MRLARLNLTRYGKFTDFSIDFGPREPGQPDFHIVYGPNESGKTTTLSAYLDLLFGIEQRSIYKFLHDYDTMQIGGVLESSGGARQFSRVKRPSNSLLDAKGQVISENAIAGELGGLGREDYKLKFSLDADTLEAGGKNILASKGDLGELLFSASAGVADLSHKLEAMRSSVENFFKKGARKHELAELKGRLKELDEKKQGIDTLSSRYARLTTERNEASDLYEKALKDRAEADVNKARVQCLQGALPRLETLKELAEQLKPLSDVPEASSHWREKVSRLQTQATELEADLKAVVKDIERLEGEADEIVVDETALNVANRLGELAAKRARYVTADSDIPKLQPQIDKLNAQIAGVMRVLEREDVGDPSTLLIGASVVVALRGLIESWAGVEKGLKNADGELAKAREKEAEETDKLHIVQTKAGVSDAVALRVLGAVVAEIRKEGLETRRGMAVKTLARRRDEFTEKKKLLAPWQEEMDDLLALHIPDDGRIERWKMALAASEKAVEDGSDEIGRLATELTSLRAQRAAFDATARVVTESESAHVRSDREAAWAEHRRTLTGLTADAFESTLRADDMATAARIAHATEAAQVNSTVQAIMIREKELERAQELCAQAIKKCDETRAEVTAAIKAVSSAFPDAMKLVELESWKLRRERALEALDAFNAGERELRETEADIEAASVKLKIALGKAGIAHVPTDSLESLIVLALAALDEATAIKSQSDIVDGARRALRKREADLEKAQGEVNDWKAKWKAACGRCWIAETHADPSISLVREILSRVDELRPYLSDRAGLEDRLGKMERDQKALATDVAALAAEMGEVQDGRPVLIIADRMAARAKEAGDKKLVLTGKIKDLADARRREAAYRDDLERGEAEKVVVFAYFGVETLAAAAERLDQAKVKADLLKRRADEERLITQALGVETIEEAEAILKDVDPAVFSTEKAKADNLFSDADARQRDHYLAMSKATDQIDAIGGDEAVALIDEQRRTVCLEIEDKARQWLRMGAGLIAAEQALRVYREKHRSSMMANASEAFSTISRGAYRKLATQPEGDGEILVGIGADGKSKKASELSKGTRFQLYLALRVAGYQEYAMSRQPPSTVPFVADDIMETFDDFRAEEAFRLLSKMAEVGQVIYMTHHEHLCGIARKICPDVRIHTL